MTQQRILFVLFSFLFAAACGGGPGQVVEVDSDGPPDYADQPPPASNQNPVSAGSLPPNSPPPPGPPGGPVTPPPGGGGGGGSCVAECNRLPDRGCATPEQGCEQGCAELLADECGAQVLAFQACALPIACPQQFEDDEITMDQAQQILALCASQWQALLACDEGLGSDG